VDAVDAAAALLADHGHYVDVADPAFLSTGQIDEDLAVRNGVNVASALDAWARRTGAALTEADVEPTTWELAQRARGYSAARLAGALAALQAHGRRTAAWIAQRYELLLSPTVAEPPPPLGEFRRDDDPMWPVERSRPFTVFTLPFNISGQPAISLPLHWSSAGLPIGIQLAAPYAREDLLLSVAGQLETACPWWHRRPVPESDLGEF
jgi:amidase